MATEQGKTLQKRKQGDIECMKLTDLDYFRIAVAALTIVYLIGNLTLYTV